MKVERKIEAKFKPIIVSITVENKEELLALKEMCKVNSTIPDVVKEWNNDVDERIILNFLNRLFDKLT